MGQRCQLFIILYAAGEGDYDPETQTITFPAGQTLRTVTVDTLEDSSAEQLETFGAVLSSPNGNGLPFSIGGQDTATADIIDDDCKIFKPQSLLE